jgi:hypothetical protein
MSETYKYYHYEPNFPGAIVMAVLFGLSTIWHGFLIAKHRTWYFIPLAIGGTCQYFHAIFPFLLSFFCLFVFILYASITSIYFS